MAWDKSGSLYVTEMGPSKNDEINLVLKGKNYGWPEQQCSGDRDFVNAIMCYDPEIEPGGIVFYSGDKLEFNNDMIMASMKPEKLDRLKITGGEIQPHQIIWSADLSISIREYWNMPSELLTLFREPVALIGHGGFDKERGL